MLKWIIIATLLAACAVGVMFWLIPTEAREGSKTINYVERFRTLKPKAE